MKALTCTAILLAAPLSAAAAEGGTGSFSFAASLAQMLGALSVVLGLIYLLTHLGRRLLKGGIGFKRQPGNIRIVETRHLAPKQALLLVEVAGEYLLLSSGSDGISFIKQIDMLEELEVIEVLGAAAQRPKGLFQAKLEGFMAKLQSSPLIALAPRSEA